MTKEKAAELADAEESTNPETAYLEREVERLIKKAVKHFEAHRKRAPQLRLVGKEDRVTCRIEAVEHQATRGRVAELVGKEARKIEVKSRASALDSMVDAGLGKAPGDMGYVYTAGLAEGGRVKMRLTAVVKRTLAVDR